MAQAGKFRHRLTVQRFNETGKDDAGQPEGTWQALKPVYAHVERLSGRTAEVARQMYTDATHTVHTRWFPGLTVKDRLQFGSRLFHIREVDNVEERNIDYVLTCTEDLTP